MDISKKNADHRSEPYNSTFQELKHSELVVDTNHLQSNQTLPQARTTQSIEKAIKLSAVSFDSCDAHELMHCYQIAIDFGVPTAERALAMYQAKSLAGDQS